MYTQENVKIADHVTLPYDVLPTIMKTINLVVVLTTN